jgi:hypothetical protein
MHRKRREAILKLGALSIVGLFLLDRLVISWAVEHWKAQSIRIADLQEKVTRGRALQERSRSLRGRFAEMERTDLRSDDALAENDVYKAVGRWASVSRISFTNLTQQWRDHDEGYRTLECRAAASGDQAALARLLFELETDPLPARVSELELTSRDAQGKQLSLSLRFTFVRLPQRKGAL